MSIESKKLIIDCIKHKNIHKVPTMYRGEPSTNERLIKFFNLSSLEDDWERLIELLGADNYSDGETLGGFSTYFPKYTGPDFKSLFEINRFDIWGINSEEVYIGKERHIVFSKIPPLGSKDEIAALNNYPYPKLEWFDFTVYKNNTEQVSFKSHKNQREIKLSDFKKSEAYFLNASCLNSIFMVSTYLRGMEKLFMDFLLNPLYAETLIAKIGEFMVEFNEKNLAIIGEFIDLYGIWDDFADQEGLMISPSVWRKFYKPWYTKLINEAKKYNLLVCFHVCGNCSEIIGDLIEIGVDILDPIQVSAKNMNLENLKAKFGENICFHGGLDTQKFLPFVTPEEVRKEVRRIKNLFNKGGGLILGPSHYLTSDIPIDNILAIYSE
jgi:uroporphyrinogen decarboxylase